MDFPRVTKLFSDRRRTEQRKKRREKTDGRGRKKEDGRK
jgi:hypothetical protein